MTFEAAPASSSEPTIAAALSGIEPVSVSSPKQSFPGAAKVVALPCLEIRPLTPELLPATIRLGESIFEGHDDKACMRMCQECSISIDRTGWPDVYQGIDVLKSYVMISDGEVVGYSGIRSHSDKPKEAWISWFYLSPDLHGNGAGKKLLDFTLNLIRSDELVPGGFDAVRLWTTRAPIYQPALRLYESRGFVTHEISDHPVSSDGYRFVVCTNTLRGAPTEWMDYRIKGFMDDQPPPEAEADEWGRMTRTRPMSKRIVDHAAPGTSRARIPAL